MSAVVVEPIKRPMRKRSGTAKWHMSREAVSLPLEELYGMDEEACWRFFVEARFGSKDTVRCPYCGSIGRHYLRISDKRWKCHGCKSTFTITTGTVFAQHKISLRKLLLGALTWVNSSAGQPALQLKRHIDTTYNTVFTLQHKLREALMRGYNVGLLNGDVEIDGAYQAGFKADEKRGKPRVAPGEAGLTDEEIKDDAIAKSIIGDFVASSESYLNSDSATGYSKQKDSFLGHRAVTHSKELVGPDGENNNQAEEFNFRYDRAEKGIYLNIEAKYLLDYAVEIAFRSDTRRLPNGTQLQIALNMALSVGPSQFWRGFTHGRHRTLEPLRPSPRPAPSSGPMKGRHPISSANGRPPR